MLELTHEILTLPFMSDLRLSHIMIRIALQTCLTVLALLFSASASLATECFDDPNKCSNSVLCVYAIDITTKKWDGNYPNHVREAKRRGLYFKSITRGTNDYANCSIKAPTPKVIQTDNPDKTYKVASGTGFYVSDEGHIITNHHVIDGCKDMKVHSKGRVLATLQIAADKQNDLALLKIAEAPSHVFALSNDSPYPLQEVIVAGFPFGDKYSSSLKFTQGIVSSLTGMGNNYSEIQIDAALQQGNSGGPIIDEYGNIIAVAVAKLDAKYMFDNFGIIPENTNFGVKVSAVRNLMEGNGVSFKVANKEVPSRQDLSRQATDGTVFLTCWMTMAQVEKLRSKKVMFENLE